MYHSLTIKCYVKVTFILVCFHSTLQQPLLEDRNGEIVSYDIFYRLKPANSSIDTPFEGILYLRNDSDTEHSFTLDGLEEEQIYEVMMRASTFVGPGPNSTLFEAMTLKRMALCLTHACIQTYTQTFIYVPIFFRCNLFISELSSSH